jgi:hypothetical protein
MYITCDNCGIAKIEIDGKPYPEIDTYDHVSRRLVRHIDTALPPHRAHPNNIPDQRKKPRFKGF